MVGAHIPQHRGAGGLQLLHMLGRSPGVIRSDDGQHRSRVTGGHGIQGLALASAPPLLGYPDHPVEGAVGIEPAGCDGLQDVHATHAEAQDPDRVPAGQVRGSHSVTQHAVVLQSGGGGKALGNIEALPGGVDLEGGHGPALPGGQAGHQVVEQWTHSHDVGNDDQPPGRRTGRRMDQLGGGPGRKFGSHAPCLAHGSHARSDAPAGAPRALSGSRRQQAGGDHRLGDRAHADDL